MATRCSFENSNEIGVFAALTNGYCLTGTTNEATKVQHKLGGTIRRGSRSPHPVTCSN